MSALLRDFKHGFRALRRSPGLTLIAILTLALGIGTTTAVFSLVDAVLFRPLPAHDPGRLVRVFARSESAPELSNSSYPVYIDYRDQSWSFTSLGADAAVVGSSLMVSGRAYTFVRIVPAVGAEAAR